jgi:hypothetical protein
VTLFADGLYLAIGSHDNMIYIYSVSSDGAKSSRFGRCVVRKGGRGGWDMVTRGMHRSLMH